MPSPDISTPSRDSVAVGGGGTGAVNARGDDDWLRVYDRVVAMLPRVEALAAAGRAGLEAVNEIQHEFWEARDVFLQQRLLQAEESRRRWEAAYIDLQPSGDDRKFAELQESDFEDLTTSIDVLAAENTEFQIKVKEVKGATEHSQNAADHVDITRDLKAELGKLKQAYEAVCSEKDKKVSEITAERDFVRDQFKTLERDYADLLSCREKEATQATEAAEELQQNIEQPQVASENKDDEIRRLPAQEKAKAAEAKRKLVRGNKLQEVHCMTKEIDREIEIGKDQQPETSPKHKKDLSKTGKRGCSTAPALREEAKDYSSKKTIAEYGQPETSQKRESADLLSDISSLKLMLPSEEEEVVKAPLARRIKPRGYYALDEEPIKKKFKKKKAPLSSARPTASKASSPAKARQEGSSVPSEEEVVKAPLARRIKPRGYYALDEEPIKKKFKKKQAPLSSARPTASKASSPAKARQEGSSVPSEEEVVKAPLARRIKPSGYYALDEEPIKKKFKKKKAPLSSARPTASKASSPAKARQEGSSVPSEEEVVKAPLARRIKPSGYYALDEEPIKKKFKKKQAPSSSARPTASKTSSPARELENERDAPPTASGERVETTREVYPEAVELPPKCGMM